MRLPRHMICVLATGALVAFASFAAARIEDAPTPASDFQRPANLVPTSSPAQDRVWALGRTLFFDPSLSASRALSCAGCHEPDASWTDHLSKGQGEGQTSLKFRVPTLLNAGQLDRFGWTGRFADLEDAIFFAMNSPLNMNLGLETLLDRLRTDADYPAAFAAAFADRQISKANVGAALSRFVRSIVSAPAPFDRWLLGDLGAISPAAVRGFDLFRGKARCAQCHSGWTLTDGSFHDIGTATGDDRGRGDRFKTSVKLQYAFKTPTLRNVAVRAPYMHDGSLATLRAVIDLYDRGGIDRPSRAEAIGPLHLDDDEKTELVAFLETLTGPSDYVVPRD